MRKHGSSVKLCWRRYCKRAEKQGLRAYSWKSYLCMYKEYWNPPQDSYNPKDIIRKKLVHYNRLMERCQSNIEYYTWIKTEKEEWLKSLHLDESKILDNID